MMMTTTTTTTHSSCKKPSSTPDLSSFSSFGGVLLLLHVSKYHLSATNTCTYPIISLNKQILPQLQIGHQYHTTIPLSIRCGIVPLMVLRKNDNITHKTETAHFSPHMN